MIRKQVYVSPEQEKFLKQLSKKFGQSEAELIRQAIDQALAADATPGARDVSAWEREKAFIRSLMAQKPLHRRRRWTRAELYEEER